MENNKYPEHIMKVLRQRYGLDENDTKKDTEFNSMSPSEVLEEVCNWDGICGYAYRIKNWVKDIYGFDLDSMSLIETKKIYKVGIIMPDFCDQRYLRDRDREVETTSEKGAIEEFRQYAFKHYFNDIERRAYNLGKIRIGIIGEEK